jgi:hypothetical protein
MPPSDLEDTFHVYWDEIRRCRHGKCYWAMLHLVVSLPDICASLESPTGKTNGKGYIDWCDRNVRDEVLSGRDWYSIRCAVFHQGRTSTRRRLYQFSDPNGDASDHGKVVRIENVEALNLNIQVLVQKVWAGISGWLHSLDSNQNSAIRGNVIKNMNFIVRVSPRDAIPIRGWVVRLTIPQF